MNTIDDLDVGGRRVLVRLDLNVPMDGGRVAEDARIRASLPTLTALISRDARVVVCAHLGRPGDHPGDRPLGHSASLPLGHSASLPVGQQAGLTVGQPDPRYSLAPVAARLSGLLGRPVALAAATVGPQTRAAVAALPPGGILMLENVRFNQAETSEDDDERGRFADELAALADAYVGDGFGAVHRKQASVYDVALRLPNAAGYLIQAEVAALSRLTTDIRRPFVVVLGGAKVADKIGALGGLIGRADRIIIGGAMAFPFLAALGHKMGTSLLDPAHVDIASDYLDQAARAGVPIVLPSDLMVAPERASEAQYEIVDVNAVPPDRMALDIGLQSARSFEAEIATAATAFWSGPMGVFELAPYAVGTWNVIRGLTTGHAFTVVSGGHTTAALHMLGVAGSLFGHVSTAGGASLEFIEGKTLPGLAALYDGLSAGPGRPPGR